jgi:hypothetical protein
MKDANAKERVAFLSASYLLGVWLGGIALHMPWVPEVNRFWCSTCAFGGAMAAWGSFDGVVWGVESLAGFRVRRGERGERGERGDKNSQN